MAGGLRGEELEQQVDARIGRRRVLECEDPPPFRVILSELVLRNSLSNTQAWRGQLESLVQASERPSSPSMYYRSARDCTGWTARM